jgi:PAS domain S-box-containing protein
MQFINSAHTTSKKRMAQMSKKTESSKSKLTSCNAGKLKGSESTKIIDSFIDSLPDAFLLLDENLNLVRLNHAAQKILGLFAEEAVGQNISDAIPGITESGRYDQYLSVLRTGKPLFSKDMLPDSRFGDMHLSVKAFKVGDGLGIIASEFTERKWAEKELQQSELKFRIVADNTYDFEHWRSPEGNFIYASPSCKRVTGHSAEEFIADPNLFDRIILLEDRPAFHSHEREVLQKRIPNEIEFRITLPDGTLRWIDHICIPVFDSIGKYLGIRGTNRDITEHKNAEEALRKHQEQLEELVHQRTKQLQESETKYRNLFNNAEVGLFRFRISDGKLLECNELYAKLIGYDSRKECLVNHVASEHYVDPNARSKMLKVLEEQGQVRNFEAQVARRDGSLIWVSDTARIYPTEGYIEGAVADITEKKMLQEKLIASERLATLGQFSGSMAHELRNSLATISSSAYYLKSKLTGGEEKIQTHLERIKSSVDSATSIIQSLLNLTRMKEPSLAKLDLREVVSGVTGADVIPSTVRAIRNLPEQAVEINADREQLRMAFRNIVDNAVQAMESKGMLTVTVRNIPDGKSEVSFADTGPGIPKESLEKIFEPLFSTKAKGIGFGLSIAKMVIDKHSGTIEAKSELGQGATMIIRLPRNLSK